MELKDFLGKFADQFEETNRSEFTKQTIFKDLKEWNSLMTLSIIAMIDEEYNFRIKGAEIREISTIGELHNFVETKI